MHKIIIDNTKHIHYPLFKKLYATSFPMFEQRTEEQQERAFASPDYHLVAYEEQGIFIGFISYWEFDTYLYIEHFAVNRGLRGRGYGREILLDFIAADKLVLLEIDPIVDDISAARLRFYKKCGFYENPYPHAHPPYREGYKAHSLVVLTSKREITEHEYLLFDKELKGIVMNNE